MESRRRQNELLENDTNRKNGELMQKIREMDDMRGKYEDQLKLFNQSGSTGLNTSQRVSSIPNW